METPKFYPNIYKSTRLLMLTSSRSPISSCSILCLLGQFSPWLPLILVHNVQSGWPPLFLQILQSICQRKSHISDRHVYRLKEQQNQSQCSWVTLIYFCRPQFKASNRGCLHHILVGISETASQPLDKMC